MTDETKKILRSGILVSRRRVPLSEENWKRILKKTIEQGFTLKEIAERTDNAVQFLLSKLMNKGIADATDWPIDSQTGKSNSSS